MTEKTPDQRIEDLEKKLEALSKRIKAEEDKSKYEVANLKVNYFSIVFIALAVILTHIYGPFTIAGIEINDFTASLYASIAMIIIFFKEGVYATKYVMRKMIGLTSV